MTHTGEHQRDLPAQVDRVTEARVQPLSQEGRCLVCGIASQEDAALAPAVGGGGVKLVDGLAPDLVVLGLDPGGEQLADLLVALHLLARLAG